MLIGYHYQEAFQRPYGRQFKLINLKRRFFGTVGYGLPMPLCNIFQDLSNFMRVINSVTKNS